MFVLSFKINIIILKKEKKLGDAPAEIFIIILNYKHFNSFYDCASKPET